MKSESNRPPGLLNEKENRVNRGVLCILIGIIICLSVPWMLQQEKVSLADNVFQAKAAFSLNEQTDFAIQTSATDPDLEILDDWDEPLEEAEVVAETSETAKAELTKKPEIISGNSIVHRTDDFKKGRLENMVITDGLQLGPDILRHSRQEPFQSAGIYFSPVFATAEAFDTFAVKIEMLSEAQGRSFFEFCTAHQPDDWSAWEEARQPGKAVLLESSAKFFQYRITLLADQPDTKLAVRSVTIKLGDEGKDRL